MAGCLPALLAGTPNGSATGAPRFLSPREEPTFNSLTQGEDEDESDGEYLDPGSPPDFVGSKYQRTAGDGQPGTFGPDWVARVTGSNKAEYLVLAQIAYWFAATKKGKLKVTVFWQDRWWLYKFYRQLAADVRVLTPSEVRWGVRSLVKKGILITHYNPGRRKPKLYRIDPGVVGELDEAAERRIEAAGRKQEDW
ncbi:hypothetical protein [Urbifossiella limnaea]|uniref:hypothetical protein n=1 Tax=Urbifossiella limnaea TaxID=2528023 RepID=UPI0011A7B592|nr:hypothetical protein [Urbifossiella limnaea]